MKKQTIFSIFIFAVIITLCSCDQPVPATETVSAAQVDSAIKADTILIIKADSVKK